MVSLLGFNLHSFGYQGDGGCFCMSSGLSSSLKESKLSRSVVSDSATAWTVAYQAPPPMGFSRQEYWSGLPFPFPGDLPSSGIEPWSPTFQADTLTSEPPGKPLSSLSCLYEPYGVKFVTHL